MDLAELLARASSEAEETEGGVEHETSLEQVGEPAILIGVDELAKLQERAVQADKKDISADTWRKKLDEKKSRIRYLLSIIRTKGYQTPNTTDKSEGWKQGVKASDQRIAELEEFIRKIDAGIAAANVLDPLPVKSTVVAQPPVVPSGDIIIHQIPQAPIAPDAPVEHIPIHAKSYLVDKTNEQRFTCVIHAHSKPGASITISPARAAHVVMNHAIQNEDGSIDLDATAMNIGRKIINFIQIPAVQEEVFEVLKARAAYKAEHPSSAAQTPSRQSPMHRSLKSRVGT